MVKLLVLHLLVVFAECQLVEDAPSIEGDWHVVEANGYEELHGAVFSFRAHALRIKWTKGEYDDFHFKLFRTADSVSHLDKSTFHIDLLTPVRQRSLGLLRFADSDRIRISLAETVDGRRPKTLRPKPEDQHIVFELRREPKSTLRITPLLWLQVDEEPDQVRGGLM